MANKPKLVQGGDGTAIPAGFVGEQLTYASSNVSLPVGTTSICIGTPSAGRYQFFGRLYVGTTGSATSIRMVLRPNTDAGVTGMADWRENTPKTAQSYGLGGDCVDIDGATQAYMDVTVTGGTGMTGCYAKIYLIRIA